MEETRETETETENQKQTRARQDRMWQNQRSFIITALNPITPYGHPSLPRHSNMPHLWSGVNLLTRHSQGTYPASIDPLYLYTACQGATISDPRHCTTVKIELWLHKCQVQHQEPNLSWGPQLL